VDGYGLPWGQGDLDAGFLHSNSLKSTQIHSNHSNPPSI
jgi:hypothetical protein